ncbi:MAG: transglutaminase family protein [Rhodovibrionaceae bacterium]
MPRLAVRHETVYRYARPVSFGEHRLMFRPRDSHDLRLVDTALTISPRAKVRWLHDVFSNSIAMASFKDPAEELRFESNIVIDHYGLSEPEFSIEPYARTYPFTYPAEESPDLARSIERDDPDPDRLVDAWAKRFLNGGSTVDTQSLLVSMTKTIHAEFSYQRRYAIGVQTPTETLKLGCGSCRDLALLMMASVRSLGLAARFVSGYLYDSSLDNRDGTAVRGAGDTHAWVQVYLPGAGWAEFDPTNGLVGGANLIRIAVARNPAQAVPLQGSYFGATEDYIGMSVEVEVSRVPKDGD